MRKEFQAILVAFVVVGLGLIYVGYQVSTLETQLAEQRELILECGVAIDNGTDVSTEVVNLTKGATALEALRRIAVVETTYYAGVGEYIVSINGLAKDPEADKYWMWYILNIETSDWESVPVGAGNYKLADGDNIKFSYEIPAW